MCKRNLVGAALLLMCLGTSLLAQVAPPAGDGAPKTAANRIIAVTVYQGTALVTREVEVGEGSGLMEFVVSPLPPQTIDSSLYTESSDGIRVLTTRYRTRAVMEDTRAEVRARQDQIKKLNDKNQELQKQLETIAQDLQLLAKLENFTAATMQQLTEKGQLNADSTIKLADYLMDRRNKDGAQQVATEQQIHANQQQVEFLQRQLGELAAGANRTEREAVIVVDKANAAAGKVRLNYLVNAASWMPQYKLRAGAEKDPVQVEYLAAIEQQSGEDWNGVDLVLSTAQPRLNAAPPELAALDISVSRLGGPVAAGSAAPAGLNQIDSYKQSRAFRAEAQKQLAANNTDVAQGFLNSAAASDQFAELLAVE
ncbi:MAG TPA: mucoidy inhibitor MuiA family protein, partial [Humisphaera sp.]|nr:mucoidy inhibitor MuiA family protein [Humisphaera sp.]